MLRTTKTPLPGNVWYQAADLDGIMSVYTDTRAPARMKGLPLGRLRRIDPSLFWARNPYGGICTWEEAEHIARVGWPVGGERVQEFTRQFLADLPEPHNVRRAFVWLDHGEEICPDRLLHGEPDTAWRCSLPKLRRASRVVSIAAKVGGRSTVTLEQALWTGAQLLALALVLEHVGYRVEIRAVCETSHDDRPSGQVFQDVIVKEAADALRPDLLAAWCCHVGIYRTAFLDWRAQAGVSYAEMGRPELDPAPLLTRLEEYGVCAAPDLCLPAAYDMQEAKRQVQQALSQIERRV